MRKYAIIVFIILVTLSFTGCGSNNLFGATATPIFTKISTATPSLTPTFTPTLTPTITFTPTPASISIDNAKMLVPLQSFQGKVEGFDWYPQLVFSPDFNTYTTHANDHTLILWDATTGKQINTLVGFVSQIWGTAFSHDGKYLATSDEQGNVILWDANTGEKVRELSINFVGISSVTFTQDSKIVGIASGNNDKGILILFDVETGERLQRIICGGWCSKIAFSPNGQIMAWDLLALGGRNSIVLQDVTTGKRIHSLPGQAPSTAFTFSPDGKMIAASDRIGTIILWDVASGQQISTFDHISRKAGIESGEECPFASAFSPDGRVLATGYEKGSVVLWDVVTTNLIYAFRGNSPDLNNPILSIAFSLDGTVLASTYKQNSGMLWELSNSLISTPPPTTQTPSVVLLDVSGSYPVTNAIPSRYTADEYSFSVDAGTHLVELNTDDNTNICHLVWQIRPSSADPNSPASWFGDSNFPGLLSITQTGEYVISVVRVRHSNECQVFTYTLRVAKP